MDPQDAYSHAKKSIEVVVKDEKEITNDCYGLIIQVKLRKNGEVTHQRWFKFKNELNGLFRIARYVSALKELAEIKPETHFIEVKPTLRHKTPKWLLSQLSKFIVAKMEPNSVEQS